MTKINKAKIDFNRPVGEYLSKEALAKLRECVDKLITVEIKNENNSK